MFYKMIKCTSELGHHATTVVLCQFVSDTDYPTAFRSLEDRSSNDAMDAMYQFMWDVTGKATYFPKDLLKWSQKLSSQAFFRAVFPELSPT